MEHRTVPFAKIDSILRIVRGIKVEELDWWG